jgi:hypothetical protein
VDLSGERIWLVTLRDLSLHAQQQSQGRFHIYMYTDPAVIVRGPKRALVDEFDDLLFERRVTSLLGPVVVGIARAPVPAERDLSPRTSEIT